MTYLKPIIKLDPDWTPASENVISIVSSENPKAVDILKSMPEVVLSHKSSAYYKNDSKNNTSLVPLPFCANTVEMFEFLKSCDYPVYKLSSWHQNLLSYAIQHGKAELAEHLIATKTFDPFYKNSNTLRYSLYNPQVLKVLIEQGVMMKAEDKELKYILLYSFCDLVHSHLPSEQNEKIIESIKMLHESMPERINQVIRFCIDEDAPKAKYDLLSNSILLSRPDLVSLILNSFDKPQLKIIHHSVQNDRNGKRIYCTMGLACAKAVNTGNIDVLILLAKTLQSSGGKPESIEKVTARNKQSSLYDMLFDNPIYKSPFKDRQSEFLSLWPWPQHLMEYVKEKEANTRWRMSLALKDELKILCEHQFLSTNFNAQVPLSPEPVKVKAKI